MRVRVWRAMPIRVVAGTALTLFTLATLLLLKQRKAFYSRVACYAGEDDDPADGGLDDATAMHFGEDGIFFLETSCRVEPGGGLHLAARQACAVESAVRAHPHRPVSLLVTAPASRNPSSWSAPARRLLLYDNVRVARIRGTRYTRGTPLAEWWADGAVFLESICPVVHASDALRLLTLWRFGGIYLDLDFVVLRSLNGLSSFACALTNTYVANGAIGFGREPAGRRIARICLREVRYSYSPKKWGCIGPVLIKRVLQHMCGTKMVSEMTREQCGGFEVLPAKAFYSIQWSEGRRFFEEANASRTMEAVARSYAVHLWRAHRNKRNVTLDSQQPYAQLARKHCPRVAAAAGTYF